MRHKREVTTDTTETQRIVRNCYEKLHAKILDNLGETDNLLETYNLPKLNQEEAESLNRLITTSEIEAGIKKLQAHKSPGPDGFTSEFYQTFTKVLTPILLKPFQKFQEQGSLPTLYMKPILS